LTADVMVQLLFLRESVGGSIQGEVEWKIFPRCSQCSEIPSVLVEQQEARPDCKNPAAFILSYPVLEDSAAARI